MTLTVRHRISIAEIVVYTPLLFGGIFLSTRHGFGRNAGWLYTILFSIIRILGSALDLATVSQPTNIGLYVAAAILQSVGLSALVLIEVGLLGRVLGSISNSAPPLLNPTRLRIIQLIIVVGLILGIVGGNEASNSVAQTGSLQANTASQAGIGLMIAGFVLTVIATVFIARQVNHAEKGERRIVLAVVASLPFVLVRLIYSCIGTLGNDNTYKPVGGNPYIFLGMAVIEEMIAMAIFEGVGFTLRQLPKPVATGTREARPDVEYANQRRG